MRARDFSSDHVAVRSIVSFKTWHDIALIESFISTVNELDARLGLNRSAKRRRRMRCENARSPPFVRGLYHLRQNSTGDTPLGKRRYILEKRFEKEIQRSCLSYLYGVLFPQQYIFIVHVYQNILRKFSYPFSFQEIKQTETHIF